MIGTRVKFVIFGVTLFWLMIFLMGHFPGPFSDVEHSPAWWASMILGVGVTFFGGLASTIIGVAGTETMMKTVIDFLKGRDQ